MKKIMSVLLVVVMVFTGYVFNFNVKAEETEEIVTSGTCGDDIRWEFDEETGILSLDGTGEMYDYGNGLDTPWEKLSWDVTDIQISEGITTIGKYAFEDFRTIENLVLPDSIEEIKWSGFAHCSNLTTVEFSKNLSYIGVYAFWYCENLESVDLSETLVTKIDWSAFTACDNISTLILSPVISRIEATAFEECYGITEIEFPESLEYIGPRAFSMTSIEKVEISPKIELDIDVFDNAHYLEEVILEEGVTTIPEGTFFGCMSLENIELPDSITYIGNQAFGMSAIEYVQLTPKIELGEYIFDGAYYLEDVIIEEGVTTIPNGTFRNCESLEYIELPKSIKSIGDYAFAGCESLWDITIENPRCFIGTKAFDKDITLYGACNSRVYEYAAANGNDFESIDCDGKDVTYVVVKEPTYTSEGEYKNVCKRCGKEYYGKIEKLAKIDLTDENAKVETKKVWEYTGNAIEPLAYIKGLAEGIDYNITYSNNITPGYATITFEGLGKYTGKVYKSFKIIPQMLKIKKAKRKNNKIIVTWNKKPYITGVEIKYSTRKDMKKAKKVVQEKGTTKILKKLKTKKPYYIQIRAYSIAGKKKIYSNWSKKITVKKSIR